jgi:hypothetical protein
MLAKTSNKLYGTDSSLVLNSWYFWQYFTFTCKIINCFSTPLALNDPVISQIKTCDRT